MTDQELIERSAYHFEKDTKVSVMYATSDGQMFHSHAINAAQNHALANKLSDPLEIKRGDLNKPAEKVKTESKEESKVETTDKVEETKKEDSKDSETPKTKPKKKGK